MSALLAALADFAEPPLRLSAKSASGLEGPTWWRLAHPARTGCASRNQQEIAWLLSWADAQQPIDLPSNFLSAGCACGLCVLVRRLCPFRARKSHQPSPSRSLI
jgi:hypothetical protein